MNRSRGLGSPLPFSGFLGSALGLRGRPQLGVGWGVLSSKPVSGIDKRPRGHRQASLRVDLGMIRKTLDYRPNRPRLGAGARINRRAPGTKEAEGGAQSGEGTPSLGRREVLRGPNPAPARPSKPPFFSPALGGGRWRSREGAQSAFAARQPRRTLPRPATPNPRSAQRAPGPTTSRRVGAGRGAGPGQAEGGAGALRAARGQCACLAAGRGGTGSGGRARPPRPQALEGRRPGSGRAALVRVRGARGVSVGAPGVCRTRGHSIPEVTGGGGGQAGPCCHRLLGLAPALSGPLG